ncbi:hypothetical protein HPPN120_02725 [Helicobacter pylori Puno120]|nr:hypothetical protein HPPN120_02725 [Helicobacter pylori Puno120]
MKNQKPLFSGEFVIDMAFGKKIKSLKLALGFLLLAAFYYCLALYTHQHIYFLYGLLISGLFLFIEAKSLAY